MQFQTTRDLKLGLNRAKLQTFQIEHSIPILKTALSPLQGTASGKILKYMSLYNAKKVVDTISDD